MTGNKRIVLSSDHTAIALRQTIAAHIAARGWEAVDIGPTTPEFLSAQFEGGRHVARVEMIEALER
jgi:ribose 5-phosphate isomerase B